MKHLSHLMSEALSLNNVQSKELYVVHDKEELDDIIYKRVNETKEGVVDLNDLDVTNITDMSYLFDSYDMVSFDVSGWDVSNVKYMDYMFYKCWYFKSDLSSWDVSNVNVFALMFYECRSLKGDYSKWNIKGNVNMNDMFDQSSIQTEKQARRY